LKGAENAGAEMTNEKMKKTLEDLGASLVEMLKKTCGETQVAPVK